MRLRRGYEGEESRENPEIQPTFDAVGASALVREALKNPECTKLFGSKHRSSLTAADVFEGIVSGKDYGRIQFKNEGAWDPVRNTGWGIANTRPEFALGLLIGRITGVVITINSYSDNKRTATYWNDNDMTENANTLLHELGHALRFLGFRGGDFKQNDRNPGVNAENSNLIDKNCLNR